MTEILGTKDNLGKSPDQTKFDELVTPSKRLDSFRTQLKILEVSFQTPIGSSEFKKSFTDKFKYVQRPLDATVGNHESSSTTKTEDGTVVVDVYYNDKVMGNFTLNLNNAKDLAKKNSMLIDFAEGVLREYSDLNDIDRNKKVVDMVSGFITNSEIQSVYNSLPNITLDDIGVKSSTRQLHDQSKNLDRYNDTTLSEIKKYITFLGEYSESEIDIGNKAQLAIIKENYDTLNAQYIIILREIDVASGDTAKLDKLQRKLNSLNERLQEITALYIIHISDILVKNPKLTKDLCLRLPSLYGYDFKNSKVAGFFKDIANLKSGKSITIKKDGFSKEDTPAQLLLAFWDVMNKNKTKYNLKYPGDIYTSNGFLRKKSLVVSSVSPVYGFDSSEKFTAATISTGTVASDSSNSSVQSKIIDGKSVDHIVKDIDLTKLHLDGLVDLHSEYISGSREYIETDLYMIQYYLLKTVFASIAQQSASKVFETLGGGEGKIEEGKKLFYTCMKNTIFNDDFPLKEPGLIHKINHNALHKNAANTATNKEAYKGKGTALDKIGGYDGTTSKRSLGIGNLDSAIRHAASEEIAKHFGTPSVAITNVFNPTTGIFEENEIAGVFRSIAKDAGIQQQLGVDWGFGEFWHSGLGGAYDVLGKKIQDMGGSKSFANGTKDVLNVATEIGNFLLTAASAVHGVKGVINLTKRIFSSLFGTSEAAKKSFEDMKGNFWSSAKYGAGSALIGFFKNPSGYFKNNMLVDAVGGMASPSIMEKKLLRKVVDDGILRFEANTVKSLTDVIFDEYSPQYLINEGILKKGRKGIIIDPQQLSKLATNPSFSEQLQGMSKDKQQLFLIDLASAMEKVLASEYGLNHETFNEISSSDESMISLLKKSSLRKVSAIKELQDLSGLPGLNIETLMSEITALDDATLEKRIEKFKEIRILKERIEEHKFNGWKAINPTFTLGFDSFNEDILQANNTVARGESPTSFKEYWLGKLSELALEADNQAVTLIFGNMCTVLANLAHSRNVPDQSSYWSSEPNTIDLFDCFVGDTPLVDGLTKNDFKIDPAKQNLLSPQSSVIFSRHELE